jgi:hypothetical protein
LRPVVRATESHELGRAIDQVYRRERRADQRAHAIERELVNLFGAVSGEERVDDFTDRNELPHCLIGLSRGRSEAFGT